MVRQLGRKRSEALRQVAPSLSGPGWEIHSRSAFRAERAKRATSQLQMIRLTNNQLEFDPLECDPLEFEPVEFESRSDGATWGKLR